MRHNTILTSRLRIILCLLYVCLIYGCSCDPQFGFGGVEANFQLAHESRLPKWFTLPPEYKREDVSVEIILYTPNFFENNVKVVLKGPEPDYKTIEKKIGIERWHPITEQRIKTTGQSDYPNFTIIEVDGVEEVLVQKRRDDILYISDDPEVTSIIRRE